MLELLYSGSGQLEHQMSELLSLEPKLDPASTKAVPTIFKSCNFFFIPFIFIINVNSCSLTVLTGVVINECFLQNQSWSEEYSLLLF